MVADANAARRDQDHNATLHTIYRTFGDVRPTADVLELIHNSWQFPVRKIAFKSLLAGIRARYV